MGQELITGIPSCRAVPEGGGLLTSLAHFLALGLTWYQSRRRQTAAVRVDILLMRRDLLFYWHDACNQSPTAYEEYHRMSEQIIDRLTCENDVEHASQRRVQLHTLRSEHRRELKCRYGTHLIPRKSLLSRTASVLGSESAPMLIVVGALRCKRDELAIEEIRDGRTIERVGPRCLDI